MSEKRKFPVVSQFPAPIPSLRGSGYVPPKTHDPHPNWAKWKHMKTAVFWDAVALALNINPESLKYDNAHSNWGYALRPNNQAEVYYTLWEIVKDRLREINDYGTTWEVELARFAEFVESLGSPDYTLPADFPRPPPKEETEKDGVSRPPIPQYPPEDLPPYMTSKLRGLFDIMREIQAGQNKVNIGEYVRTRTGKTDPRDVSALAALINPRPHPGKTWLSDRGD